MDASKVTRIEVIDQDGRRFVSHNNKDVTISIQDGGRTLKVFCGLDNTKPPINYLDASTDDALLECVRFAMETGRWSIVLEAMEVVTRTIVEREMS